RLLFERNYTIRPDESHLDKNRGKSGAQAPEMSPVLTAAYEHIHQMNSKPERLAVLFGHPCSPYIRLDPYFMGPVPDQEAQSALDSLVAALELKLRRVVLEPGDCLVIDNYKAVHGRQPFTARYDGRDRWLKRINITRDLRKSRNARLTCDSRIIY